MFADSYILEKIEEGFVSYFASSSLSASVTNYYASNNSVADKESPCVIVQCNAMDEDFIGSGLYHCDTRIYFIYPFEDSASLSPKNAAYKVFTELLYNNENILNQVTGSTTNLKIYDGFGKGVSNSIQDNHWVSENALDIVATYSSSV